MFKHFNWIVALLIVLFSLVIVSLFSIVFSPLEAVIRFIPIAISFFVIFGLNTYYLIPRLLEKSQWKMYALVAISICAAITVVRFSLETIAGIQTGFIIRHVTKNATLIYLLFIFFSNLLSTVISLAYHFGIKWIEYGKREAVLKSEKLEAELGLLKSQVNPHFLFNTLNNIYSLCYLKDDRAPEMVLKLSEMMRYLIYECAQKEIALAKEIRFLENYLDLLKLKSSTYQNINFVKANIVDYQNVPPLLFLPFFENMFKHSDLETNPTGFAHASIAIDNRQLQLNLKNSCSKHGQNSAIAGFGVRNAQQRLELLYGNLYSLNIQQLEKSYEVNLMLPL